MHPNGHPNKKRVLHAELSEELEDPVHDPGAVLEATLAAALALLQPEVHEDGDVEGRDLVGRLHQEVLDGRAADSRNAQGPQVPKGVRQGLRLEDDLARKVLLPAVLPADAAELVKELAEAVRANVLAQSSNSVEVERSKAFILMSSSCSRWLPEVSELESAPARGPMRR